MYFVHFELIKEVVQIKHIAYMKVPYLDLDIVMVIVITKILTLFLVVCMCVCLCLREKLGSSLFTIWVPHCLHVAFFHFLLPIYVIINYDL